MQYFKFNFKLFLILAFTFIIMTVVGTLTHEMGHYAVAKYFGYDARIDYQSTRFDRDDTLSYLKKTSRKYAFEIHNGLNYPEKFNYEKTRSKYLKELQYILIGGPFQTILTGTIGFILLLMYRKKLFSEDKTSVTGWVLVFISLFWLRQSANSLMWTLDYLLSGEKSMRCDEVRIARYLELNIWTIISITGILGFIVLYFVIRMLPKNQILTFLLAGLVGGISGYYLWLIKFGKYILP